MGGYNSGRYGWRGVLEQRSRIDVRFMRRRGWLRPGVAGTLSWTLNDEPSGSVSFAVRDDGRALELRYRVLGDGDEWMPMQARVPITHIACRFGGRRFYWSCPRCARRCEVLVLGNGGRWGCRKCLNLRHQSQGLVTADRLQRHADALFARAGTDYGEGFVVKRKWMRWRTYNRLMDRAGRLDGCADAAFILRCRRFGVSDDAIADAMAECLARRG